MLAGMLDQGAYIGAKPEFARGAGVGPEGRGEAVSAQAVVLVQQQ